MDHLKEESDLYKLINVSRTASKAEIEKAFRKRALQLHPDKNAGNDEMMKRLCMAKDTLLDVDRRQQYDEEHEEAGQSSIKEISGFLHCGKRLSKQYRRKLSKHMTQYDKFHFEDNFAVISEILADLNDKLFTLINDGNSASDLKCSPSPTTDQAKHREALRELFYSGQYMSMARYMLDNANSSYISNLYDHLATGRKLEETPAHFQAGLLLLKGRLAACATEDRNHGQSLAFFQQAVLLCPTEQVIGAVCLLMDSGHLVASIQLVMRALLKQDVQLASSHQYQDRLKRTSHLRLVSRFEKAVMSEQDGQRTSNWEKAMMYIDLSMTASGVALIHCFLLAMIYMLEDISETDAKPSRVYAICNLISELALTVIVLARRAALPMTELHFNKLVFIIVRKAHQILRNKLPTQNVGFFGFFKRLFGGRKQVKPLVSELASETCRMVSNSIHRLVKVTPFVGLQLTTVADMIYLDLIFDEFAEQFYQSKVVKIENSQLDQAWMHLYKYYLLECCWKTGGSGSETQVHKFNTCREEAMASLLERKGWTAEQVEDTMHWSVIHRDQNGWLDISRPWLNLPGCTRGTNYDSIDGVVVDNEKGTFRLLCTASPVGQVGLFNHQDIVEVFSRGIMYSVFTLDPPDDDLSYHPFHELKFSPRSLEGTNLLQTLLHADYLLKMMSMGTEVSANAPHQFRSATDSVGFLSLLPPDLRHKVRPLSERRGGNRKEAVHRFWIESGILQYKLEECNEGKTLCFKIGTCPMQVKTQLMKHNSEGELVDDSEEEEANSEDSDTDEDTHSNASRRGPSPRKKRVTAETEFANDFTECYDQVGRYFPVLLRLRELAKLDAIFAILNSIYDNFEKTKKTLRSDLSSRYRDMLKQIRGSITYPQNTSSNVDRFYHQLLSDQGINSANLASGEESRAKSEIRRQLMEVDAKQLSQICASMSTALEVTNDGRFKSKVENWLNDGIFTSHTKELVTYVVEQVYPRHFEKLDRFAQNATSCGIRFGDQAELTSMEPPVEAIHCAWVPAAFKQEDCRRIYGGVCLLPNIQKVTSLSSGGGGGGSSFVRNGPPASAPVGSRYNQMNQPKNPAYQPVRNVGQQIEGRLYSGHALDRMQDRGIFRIVVENAISTGDRTSGRGQTTIHYDGRNDITVVTNNTNGRVITVRYGD